jgi:MFS family permease
MQGKLIHATRRGRLLTLANAAGAVVAIAAALVLMPLWLNDEGARFHMIFGFTGLCFVASAMCILFTVEPPDAYAEQSRGVRHIFRTAWTTLQHDRNFRRLALVGMAFGSSLVLFPHYQALARGPRLGLRLDNLMIWVVVQNAGTALFSLLTGPTADRRGNRLVLRWLLVVIFLMPVAAILLSYSGKLGATLYPAVFFFVGITPVGFKTLNNYALEISPAAEHPRYLSTLSLCIALPLLLSPAFGFLVETTSFEFVFLSISGVVFSGWLLTFGLNEPRQQLMLQPEDPGGLLTEQD